MNGQAKIELILELKNRMKTGLAKAKESVNSNIRDMKSQFANFKLSAAANLKSVANEIPGMGSAIALLANPIALVTAALFALGAAGVAAAKWSNTWATNMAEVNVTAQLTQKELDKLSDKLVSIGKRNVVPLEEIPAAFNRIISAGLDVNTSLKVLEPTLRAAKAGFTDVAVVAAAGVGVMASSGEDINKVYDILFATLNKGNAKFEDIAQYLPKIVPLAKGAGFALNETAAAWAYLTAQGQTPEAATTGIMNAMKALSNPDIALGKLNKKSGKMEGGLVSMGVQVYDDKGKIRPLTDIIDSMQKTFGKLTNEQMSIKLADVGIVDMEAKGGLLSMMQNVSKLKEITDSVVNSQGALNKAYENAKAPMDSWIILKNQFKGNIVKPFGDAILSVVSIIGDKILLVINYFKDLYNNSMLFRDRIQIVTGVIVAAFKIAVIPIKQLWNLLKGIGNLFVWIGEKFAQSNLGKGIISFYEKIRPYFIWLKEMIGQVSDILYKFMTFEFKSAWEAVKNFKMPNIDEIKNRKVVVETALSLDDKKELDKNLLDDDKKLLDDDTVTPAVPPMVPLNTPVDKITGSAAQIKNITINIDSFNKGGINTQNTNLQNMNTSQIEEWFNNTMQRVIRNVEMSY